MYVFAVCEWNTELKQTTKADKWIISFDNSLVSLVKAYDIMTFPLSQLSCSCSLLIIEHSTQRNDGPSLSHQGPSKKNKKTLLGSPSQDVEAGFSLGGPATDKDGKICFLYIAQWMKVVVIVTIHYWLWLFGLFLMHNLLTGSRAWSKWSRGRYYFA